MARGVIRQGRNCHAEERFLRRSISLVRSNRSVGILLTTCQYGMLVIVNA
jgi:hypothetical protein